jgi:hypothetical protein
VVEEEAFWRGQSEKRDRVQLLLQIEALKNWPPSLLRKKRIAPSEAFTHLPVAETRAIIPAATLAALEFYERSVRSGHASHCLS